MASNQHRDARRMAPPPQASLALSADEARRIIGTGDVTLLIERADELAKQLKQRDLTLTQVRNIFTEVRRIELLAATLPESQVLRQLRLLKPKLAYLASRQGREGRAGQALEQILVPAIDAVQRVEPDFRHFVDFCEAFVAYFSKYDRAAEG
jgi:CRISPR type III-A-associated protein Csm2